LSRGKRKERKIKKIKEPRGRTPGAFEKRREEMKSTAALVASTYRYIIPDKCNKGMNEMETNFKRIMNAAA
jgi:hypothetical protein